MSEGIDMGEFLSAIPIADFSAGAILALLVLAIVLGKFPTPGQLKDAQADRDKWRESAETWQTTTTQLGITMNKLLIYAEISNHALTDIRTMAAKVSEGGEP